VKSGNACILRGGKEALHSNMAIEKILNDAFKSAGLPDNSVQMVKNTDYQAVIELTRCEEISLVIPRGGEKLIRAVVEHSYVPVIKHYKGLCITYVDKAADLTMAVNVVLNAKTQRPATCNSTETLLIHKDIAKEFLPQIVEKLRDKKVEIFGSQTVVEMIGSGITLAKEDDWRTEWLDLQICIGVVDTIDDAIRHIAKYGSAHTDAIITSDKAASEKFVREVDSSAVLVNASTRLNDGGVFGFGAEIGISTDKIHARGPMGLPDLTSYKYVVQGNGQTRQ